MGFGESFLEYPALFPARRGGEAWGDEEVFLEFAGGPYRFSGLDSEQVEVIRTRFSELIVDSVDPAASTADTVIYRVSNADFVQFDASNWEYTLDLDSSPAALRIAGLDMMARLDWLPAIVGSIWTSANSGNRFRLVFENYFRLLVAHRLLERGGVLLHSAAVVDSDEACLFIGQSGAGKSTISRLSLQSGRRVLSDDINALTTAGGVTMVEKLPFAGELGQTSVRSECVPARLIARLRQGSVNSIRPLGRAEALAALVACSPYINSDPYRIDRLGTLLEQLLETIPAVELTFSLDGEFWSCLKEIGAAA